jgi:hypothetical protein
MKIKHKYVGWENDRYTGDITNNKTYTVRVGHSDGNTHYYPACRVSQKFAELANNETLTLSTLDTMRKLGYTMEAIYDK